MIHVYGTSHVSEESLDLIDEKLEEHNPDIVALELDLVRLNALLGDETRNGGPVFLRLVKKFQDYIGSKTGVMPGEEMLYAYEKSMQEGREVALIDQDIRITIDRLKQAPRKEKVMAVLETLAGFLMPGKFDIHSIPEEELIKQLLGELQKRFPCLYQVLVTERNHVMAEHLESLQEDDPEAEIVAFVGAAHRNSIRELLEKDLVE